MHELYPCDIAVLSRAEVEQAVGARAQTVYLGGGVVLARALTRYKLFLHSSDRGFGCHVMMDGFWEIWLTQFFTRMVKPGMRVIDVGANYGYHTMLLADMVTDAGRVLAVEPNPAAAGLLREAVLLNGFAGHVQVIESALGDAAQDSVELFVPDGEPKNAYVGGASDGRSGSRHQVALTSVDHLLADLGHVDLIKVDAEGGEEDIVAGMRTLLRTRPPALVLEFNAGRYADPAGFLRDLLDVYGEVASIDFDGAAKKVSAQTVLTHQVGKDWLLFFAAPGA